LCPLVCVYSTAQTPLFASVATVSSALLLFAHPHPLAAALATVSALSVSPPFSLCPNQRSPLGIHYNELLTVRDVNRSPPFSACDACSSAPHCPLRALPSHAHPVWTMSFIMFRARANTCPTDQAMTLGVGRRLRLPLVPCPVRLRTWAHLRVRCLPSHCLLFAFVGLGLGVCNDSRRGLCATPLRCSQMSPSFANRERHLFLYRRS
jgi:hypothetical protein